MDSKVFTAKFTLLVLVAATGPGQGTMTDMHSSAADVGKCSGDQKLCGADSFDDNFDETNLLQVQMKMSSHNGEKDKFEGAGGGSDSGGTLDGEEEKKDQVRIEEGEEEEPQDPEEPEEAEEPEEPEDPRELNEGEVAFLQEAFQSLGKRYTVNGMDSVCPEGTFLTRLLLVNGTGVNASQSEIDADCKPCADGCQTCYGPTMRECLSCYEPQVATIIHDKPLPIIGCVSKCPNCYTAVDGNCFLNRTCLDGGSEKEDALVPLPEEALEDMEEAEAKATLVQEEEEEEEEDGKEDATGSRRRRSATRRRSSRRRSPSGITGDCHAKVVKFQEEIDAWNDDCRVPKVEKIKYGCRKKDQLLQKIKTYRKISSVVKKGTGYPVQTALKALGFMPWGIGKILKVIATVAKSINGRAATTDRTVAKAERNLKKFDYPCKQNAKIDAKMTRAVTTAQSHLDKFSAACGCNCMGSVDYAITKSQEVRDYCTRLPAFPGLPSLPSISLPSWLEDILSLIDDISAKLYSVFNHRFCIGWWSWPCYSLGDIVRGLSWLFNLAWAPVNAVIKALFRAFGFPCSGISSCMNMIIGRYLDKIPGLSFPSFHLPSVPHIPTIHWPNYFPFTWNVPGCLANSIKACIEAAIRQEAQARIDALWASFRSAWWR